MSSKAGNRRAAAAEAPPAPASSSRPKLCRVCGGPGTEEDPLSKRGRHIGCAVAATASANRAMRAREGPEYDAWLASLRERFSG